MKLEVGQKLWFVPGTYSNARGREVVVVHIGRKWAELADSNRVEIETLKVDGGKYGYLGQCYLTRQEHEKSEALRREWSDFCHALSGWTRPPEGMTREKIVEARKLLGIAKREEKR